MAFGGGRFRAASKGLVLGCTGIVILGYFRKVHNWIGIVEAYFNFPSAHFLRNSSDVLLISWGSKPLLLEIDRAHLQTSACSAPHRVIFQHLGAQKQTTAPAVKLFRFANGKIPQNANFHVENHNISSFSVAFGCVES